MIKEFNIDRFFLKKVIIALEMIIKERGLRDFDVETQYYPETLDELEVLLGSFYRAVESDDLLEKSLLLLELRDFLINECDVKKEVLSYNTITRLAYVEQADLIKKHSNLDLGDLIRAGKDIWGDEVDSLLLGEYMGKQEKDSEQGLPGPEETREFIDQLSPKDFGE